MRANNFRLNNEKANVFEPALIAICSLAVLGIFVASSAWAQTAQYQRHRYSNSNQPNNSSDQLNMGSLEQKYWSAKDTDFSVVQNRKYTKAKKFALSALVGPVVNDPYNAGYNYELKLNYYFSERTGVEVFDDKADLYDSQTTKQFYDQYDHIRPDFNRDENFIGVGFNWVPFYAKMSVLGKKIIYFDMQITPFVGLESYEQLEDSGVKNPTKTSFAYGFDIVQYYFFSKHVAIQADLQNRYYAQQVVSYGDTSNPSDPPGVVERHNTGNTTNFLMGVTYFF